MINRLISLRQRMLIVSIGIVYLWFGTLKFFPGVSPAESLAKDTIIMLTFGQIPIKITYFMLAIWEVAIGISLILNIRTKAIIYLALLHILLTFTPLLFFPGLSFNNGIYSLTLIGQYIMKNLIIFCALLFAFPEKKQMVLN